MLSNKTITILAGLAVLISFAVGRWASPTKTIIETKVVTVEVEKKQTDIEQHKKVTIVDAKKPDGTETKTTVITDDKDTKSSETDQKSSSETTKKETDRSSSKVTVSALAALNISAPGVPIYGVAVTKPILGPLTVGIFGLSNSTAGVSVGLTF